MTEKRRDYWRKTIEACKTYMRPHHNDWKENLDAYELKYGDVRGINEDDVVKISRFVPKVRKIIAAIAYNYPKIYIKTDKPPIDPQSGARFEGIDEALQRAANRGIQIMKCKDQVHQALFDCMFKYRGFIKIGYNPEGDDAVPPYVSNDYLESDFTYCRHIPSEQIFVDPLASASNMSTARYVIEEMMVPLEFAKKDERFVNRNQMRAFEGEKRDEYLQTMTSQLNGASDDVEKERIREILELGEYVLLHEIHDRIHRRQITFANGVEQPVEDIDHPYSFKGNALYEDDPLAVPPRQLFTGFDDNESVSGFLCEGGFSYHSFRFDIADKFWGVPMMGYQSDLQKLIVESLTRSVDIIGRGKTILTVTQAEKDANGEIENLIATAEDFESVIVQSQDGVMERTLGVVPAEQKELEYRAASYENELLEVGQVNTETATEAAGFQADAQLNREWMQQATQGCYEFLTRSMLSIISDPRYTPENFFVNIAKEGEPPVEQLLANWWTGGKYEVEIEAGSMQILVEQLRRNDTLELANFLSGRPGINERKLTEMIVNAFNVKDTQDLFESDANADAIAAADLEFGMILSGQGDKAIVTQGMDHRTHLERHNEQMAQLSQMAQQEQQQMQQMQMQPQQMQMQQPQQQQGGQAAQAMQQMQQHIALHNQALEEGAGQFGGGGGGQAPSPPAPSGPTDIMGAVQSAAQGFAQATQAQAAASR